MRRSLLLHRAGPAVLSLLLASAVYGCRTSGGQAQVAGADDGVSSDGYGRWSFVPSDDAVDLPAYSPLKQGEHVALFGVWYRNNGVIEVTFIRSTFANQVTDETKFTVRNAQIAFGDTDPYLTTSSPSPRDLAAANTKRYAELLPWVELLVKANPPAASAQAILSKKAKDQRSGAPADSPDATTGRDASGGKENGGGERPAVDPARSPTR